MRRRDLLLALATPPALAGASPADARLAARLAEAGLDPGAYPLVDPVQAAAAALRDLVQGRVPALPGRPDLLRDAGANPLAPWLAELAGSPDPVAVVDRAARLHPDAAPLAAALAEARALAAAPLPTIPASGPDPIEPDSVDPLRIPALRARLAATDPGLAPPRGDPAVYDSPLADAVRRFQALEGLEPDGRIGRLTLAALNRPPAATIAQLRVALDLRRGLARPGPERRIEVNIPHQRLVVTEAGRVLLEMAVIVGRTARPTPPLRTRLTAIQFNPPWGVPVRNAREDLLPRFRRNPRAMAEQGFRVYGVVAGERVELDPTTIDWAGIHPDRFPFVIRQDAGEANALGRIKFIIPNDEAIFMHDTPDRQLFRRADRALSSGCIRLERPMELLDFALAGTPGWDRARAERAIASGATSGVALVRALPVRLHYTTVVIEDGALRRRADLYGLDAAHARALDAPR